MLKKSLLLVALLSVGLFFESSTVNADEMNQGSSVSLNDESTVVGPVMTYDEMIAEIAETNGISVAQAQEEMIGNDPRLLRAAEAKQYRTLSQQFSVNRAINQQ